MAAEESPQLRDPPDEKAELITQLCQAASTHLVRKSGGLQPYLLAHNRPSGDPEPSKEDFAAARRTGEALEAVGLRVVDWGVVTPSGDFWSAEEHGVLHGLRANAPLRPEVRARISSGDARGLERLEDAWRAARRKAMRAYRTGRYSDAEDADAASERLAERLEAAASEVDEGGSWEHIGSADPRWEREGAALSVEELLADAYRRFAEPAHAGEGIESREDLVAVIRHETDWRRDFLGASDAQLIEAARDAYEARAQRVRQAQERMRQRGVPKRESAR